MPYCHACDAECTDTIRHVGSHLSLPEPSQGAPLPNELTPGVLEDNETFCFQCSREFNTPATLAAHLGDARVHSRRTAYSTHSHPYALSYQSRESAGYHRAHRGRERDTVERNYPSGLNDDDPSPDSLGSSAEGRRGQPLHDAGSFYPPHGFSDEELVYESDETEDDDDMLTDADYDDSDVQSHPLASGPMLNPNTERYYDRFSQSYDQDIHAPNRSHARYTPTPFQPSGHLGGPSTLAGEAYPKDETTSGSAHYCHRCGARNHPGSHCETTTSPQSLQASSTHSPPPRNHGIMCPICLDPAVDITSTFCGHIFCASCIKEALRIRQECPVCKRAVGRWTTHPIYPVF